MVRSDPGIFAEGRDGEVRGGHHGPTWRLAARLLLSPHHLGRPQEPGQPGQLPQSDPPAERKHQSGKCAGATAWLSSLSPELCPLLIKIVMRSIHIILPVSQHRA